MAADFSAKKSNFISNCVVASQQILSAYQTLKELSNSLEDQKFFTPGSPMLLTDDDFVGENNHLDLARFTEGMAKGFFPILTVMEATVNSNPNDARENLRKLVRS